MIKKHNQFIWMISAALFVVFIISVISFANQGGNNAAFKWIATIPYGDKWGHFILFGVLTFLLNKALRFISVGFLCNKIYWGTAIVISFVVCEEFSQLFIDSRTFDYQDLIADGLGISVFSWLSKKFNTAH